MTYLLTPNGRKQLMSESTQQVDELSKKTLGSYVKKSAYDMAKTARAHSTAQAAAGASNDAARSAKKKIDYDTPAHQKGRELGKRWSKRASGIEKATNKLTKEEIDMDHFVEYVMENFPELTEKYVQENYDYQQD
jgi:hypothetical protein